ncbi:hypothetical protein N431DRAFT_367787 [Stipitochalara longipes BDJ]|nr:hypothetical protein N431DRAFT_367787 [Stipitochalara longipes BDJ]
MSTLPAITEHPTSASPSSRPADLKPRRQLACVLCQQRKVKCDRKHPCATCVKARVQCVATQAPRRRRRRFPERELLERVRKYEDLLSHHNIRFEPLHANPQLAVEKESPTSNMEGCYDSDDEQPEISSSGTIADVPPPIMTATSERWRVYEAKPILHALNHEYREYDNDDSSDDEVRQVVFKQAWDQAIENDTHLLFGWRQSVDMYTLHPQPVQMFQLWQLYLDNVNPLLKVTHTPSLQGRIIDAAGNVLEIKPELEALMFSIYCMAVSSLTENDCQAMFAESKVDLLARYQLGCQQALLNSRFQRTTNRDCLTALYLYLISVRPNTAPQSLSSMLGVAIRIAQRIGIHSETYLAKYTIIEAEVSRRLWWSLILFDTRIGEMADSKAISLLPTWDCSVPLNVNDSDLRQEMKLPPQVQGKSTDAIFAVVRSELGEFVRRSKFHLAFFGPALRSIDKYVQCGTDIESSEMDSFAKTIEERYLKICDLDNPLHFMTVWTTRGQLTKFQLMEHHFRYSGSVLHQAEAQRDAALSFALRMLECNTKLMTSPRTKGFIWMIYAYFPFMGYIQIAQHLKWRPMSSKAEKAWRIMGDNYHARLDSLSGQSSFYKLLASFILQAWDAREAAFKRSGQPLVTPQIVLSIRENLAQIASRAEGPVAEQSHGGIDIGFLDFPMSIPMGLGNYNMGACDQFAFPGMEVYPDVPELLPQDLDLDNLDWSAMDWHLGTSSTGQIEVSVRQETQVINTQL